MCARARAKINGAQFRSWQKSCVHSTRGGDRGKMRSVKIPKMSVPIYSRESSSPGREIYVYTYIYIRILRHYTTTTTGTVASVERERFRKYGFVARPLLTMISRDIRANTIISACICRADSALALSRRTIATPRRAAPRRNEFFGSTLRSPERTARGGVR